MTPPGHSDSYRAERRDRKRQRRRDRAMAKAKLKAAHLTMCARRKAARRRKAAS